MTTQTLTKKVDTLERRLVLLEWQLRTSPIDERAERSARALQKIQGLWKRKPRTAADLRRVRTRLWRTA